MPGGLWLEIRAGNMIPRQPAVHPMRCQAQSQCADFDASWGSPQAFYDLGTLRPFNSVMYKVA